MAKIPDIAIKQSKKLIDELMKHNIRIQWAVLFGSYAKGNYNEWSDIDLALISEDFSGDRWDDGELIRDHNLITNFEVQPHPYRPEDFNGDFFVEQEIIPY